MTTHLRTAGTSAAKNAPDKAFDAARGERHGSVEAAAGFGYARAPCLRSVGAAAWPPWIARRHGKERTLPPAARET